MRIPAPPEAVVRLSLSAALLLAAVAMLALYVRVALGRMAYPFSLEWMESGGLDTVRRMAAGQGVFVAPSREFIPYNYNPLYYAACAPVMRVLGEGFLPLRLVSFLASLGTMALLFAIVRKLSGGVLSAFLSSALFAATFHLTGDYFDVARADSLYVTLLIAGLAVTVWGGFRSSSAIFSGLAFGLAYLTKQSALPAIAPFLVFAAIARPGFGWLAVAVFALVAGGTTLGLSWATGGWYAFYTLEVATGHRLEWMRLPHLWTKYADPLGIATVLGATWFLLPNESGDDARPAVGAFCGGLVFSSWWVSLYSGSAPNIGMPATAAICLLFGLGLEAVLRRLRGSEGAITRRLEWLVYSACILQFVGLLYPPAKAIPTRADREAGFALVRFLADQPGEVLVPFDSQLARMAGKPGHYHALALAGARGQRGDRAPALEAQREIDQALLEGRYSAVVLDRENRGILDGNPRFGEERAFFSDEKVFLTRVGMITRPEFVHVLRPDSSAR
ncbi:MAG TPA: glycosyltransferase family 39 protein [Candidatus Eisenbacteria bacterium]|jgi:hypothetical protein